MRDPIWISEHLLGVHRRKHLLVHRSGICLINTVTYYLVECHGPEVPEYAILSHIWTDHELSLQDWQLIYYEHVRANPPSGCPHCANCQGIGHLKRRLEAKSGYYKLISFLAQAQKDGFEYAWTDAVCTDRTSPAEIWGNVNAA